MQIRPHVTCALAFALALCAAPIALGSPGLGTQGRDAPVAAAAPLPLHGPAFLVTFVEAFSATDCKIDLEQFERSYRIGLKRALTSEAWARLVNAQFAHMPPATPLLTSRSELSAQVERQLLENPVVWILASRKAGETDPKGEASYQEFWSILLDTAEADYCSHRRCEELQKAFFRLLRATAAPELAHGEHAMTGQTAGELFPDPKLAALARAACDGQSNKVSALVHGGANPNGVGGEGLEEEGGLVEVTPLIWALDCDSPTGVEALIAAGADVNMAHKFGATPVTDASRRRDTALLAVLLKHGGNPSALTDRDSALEFALDRGMSLSVDQKSSDEVWANWNALLAAGADVNQVDGMDGDVAKSAAMSNQFGKVFELLDHGYSRDLNELGRWVEYSERNGLISDEEVAWRIKVKARLIAAGVTFPVPEEVVMLSYVALDGSTHRFPAKTMLDIGRLEATYRDAKLLTPEWDLTWLKGDKVFVESANDDSPKAAPMRQVSVERVRSVYGLSDADMQSIREKPEGWQFRYFKKP